MGILPGSADPQGSSVCHPAIETLEHGVASSAYGKWVLEATVTACLALAAAWPIFFAVAGSGLWMARVQVALSNLVCARQLLVA